MKKPYLAIIALLSLIPFISNAQWLPSGTTSGPIYYNGGKVGIGTALPTDLLTISSSSPTNGTYLTLDDQATSGRTGVRLRFQSSGVAHWNIGIPANTDAFTINGWGSSSNPEFLRINSNGDVGIGTVGPSTKLDVNGVINSNSDIISTNGTVKAFLSTSNSYTAGVVGTQTNHPLAFYINSLPVARFTTEGNLGINTTDTQGYKLAVNGDAIATSMTVKLYANWPDYVFKSTYKLPSLNEVKTYIDKNQHLPEVPSEAEIVKNGLNLGEMNKLLMKKVEELTLYLIDKDKKDQEKDSLLKSQQEQIDELKNQLTNLIKKH